MMLMKNIKGIYFEIIGTGLLVTLIALATVVGIFATIPTSAMTMQKGNQTMMNKNMTSAGGMMATGNMTPPNKR
jgi:H+/gluconate symporter-like permease